MMCLTFVVIQFANFQWSMVVPIIAVFTKYDQFKLNVGMKLEDEGEEYPSSDLIEERAEELLQAEYLGIIAGRPKHIGLESKTALIGGVCIY